MKNYNISIHCMRKRIRLETEAASVPTALRLAFEEICEELRSTAVDLDPSETTHEGARKCRTFSFRGLMRTHEGRYVECEGEATIAAIAGHL